ncbi:AI-2E family transporter [Halotalea alkalilenta]|uniref:AI-2E family transporter n=1 Tax=Halotalea alkalilenta TaxID=376489 RepID=UPI0004847E65|nr:AI-2E family transporter [Halotalea alkalilenta]
MNSPALSRIQLASLLIAAVALLLILPFKLLASLLAGLLVFELVNGLTHPIEHLISGRIARWIAVGLLAVVIVGGLSLAFTGAFSFILHEVNNPGQTLGKMMEVIERARQQLPSVLVRYLPSSAEDFHGLLQRWLSGHISQLQSWGRDAVHLFVTVLIGMVLGAVIALLPTPAPNEMKPLAAALHTRVMRLAAAFHQIVFAQIKISLINTLLTSIFLLVVLPLAGVHLPLAKTLVVVTFVCGLLPVVGNLISNTVIFIVGLSLSIWIALGVLGYLVVIHKLEYFLNARIVGGQIRARAWELLLAMLVFEAIFGFAGMIAAPVYYAYMKNELKALGLV